MFTDRISQIGGGDLPVSYFMDSLKAVEAREPMPEPPFPNGGVAAAITQPVRHFGVAQAVDFHVFGKSHVAHNGHMVRACQAQNGERAARNGGYDCAVMAVNLFSGVLPK